MRCFGHNYKTLYRWNHKKCLEHIKSNINVSFGGCIGRFKKDEAKCLFSWRKALLSYGTTDESEVKYLNIVLKWLDNNQI